MLASLSPLTITFTRLGPITTMRALLPSPDSSSSSSSSSADDDREVLAKAVYGRRMGKMHFDSITIDPFARGRYARGGEGGGRGGGGAVKDLGTKLGLVCLAECGCEDVEFLAIDDEPGQHRRLVRHWRMLGLKPVRYVGDGIGDVPDRLVWGGRGLLMEGRVEELRERWERVWTEGGDADVDDDDDDDD